MKRKQLAIFLAIVILSASPIWAQDFLAKKEVAAGKEVTDFKLTDISGKEYRLSDLRGKIVMIHFWSAKCPFVLRYEKRLQQLAKDFSPSDVTVLGIASNVNETPEEIRDVAKARELNYPILLDPQSKIADQFGAITTPHVFVIDRKGVLVYEGSVDDQGWNEKNPVKKNYVHDVLQALISNTPAPYQKTNSFGCTVKRA